MQNSKLKDPKRNVVNWALLLGIVGLLVGYGLIFLFPQRPDGDITALTQFETQYGDHFFYHVHDIFWLNLAGALFAWGAFGHFLHQVKLLFLLLQPKPTKTTEVVTTNRKNSLNIYLKQAAILLMWSGVLLMWGGWAWNQTRGWQGSLFLEAGVETPLGVDKRPMVTFERFLIPPTPDGAGRALSLRLFVDEEAYEISEAHPYQSAGWTLKPHWYGLTVKSKALPQPLFFGTSGSTQALLKDGSAITVTVETSPLTVTSHPPLPDLQVTYHAILLAHFAPGIPLQQIGTVIVLVGAVGLAIAPTVSKAEIGD